MFYYLQSKQKCESVKCKLEMEKNPECNDLKMSWTHVLFTTENRTRIKV